MMNLIAAVCAVILAIVPAASAENWPQFRGADQNYSHSLESLPAEWSKTKNIRWSVAVPGEGWACPVVWDDKVFIATAVREVEGKDTAPLPNFRSGRVGTDSVYRWELHCLALDSGETLWRRVAFRGHPRIRTHPANTYASETPVTDGERVYVYFGMLGLYCYDLDGELVWSKDFGGYLMDGDWGTGSSPILHEGSLYLQIDNEEDSFLVSVDPKTGNERWRVQRDESSSWSTPTIWKNRVRTELVTCGKSVRSYDPATGELFWSMNMQGGRASASPVGNVDTLFLGNEARRDGGGTLFAIKAGASGEISPAGDFVLWKQPDAAPEFASPLLYEGNLYVFGRHRGSVGCFDPKTGERLEGISRLSGARSFWSSPWAHEGKIFCVDEAGTTFVISAGAEVGHLATYALNEEVRSSPALTNGAIILRAKNNIYCIAE